MLGVLNFRFWISLRQKPKKMYSGSLRYQFKLDWIKYQLDLGLQCIFYFYPHAFLKKRRGYCNRLRPSVRPSVCPSVCPSVRPSVRPSVTLSPPKPLDEIQPNLVCGLLTWMGCATAHFFLAPPPGALGRGQKVKYHQISLKLNYKVDLKDFLTKLCVSSHKWKILNISDGIFIWRPGSCPRGRTLGYRGGLGGPKIFFPKFNQIWCVSFLHERHMHRRHFWGPHPLGP